MATRLRYASFAAFVASLALAVPLALGETSVTPANGKEFLLPNGNLFQLDSKGVYHLVPDLPTATEMGVLWSQVKKVGSVGPIGQALTSVLTLPSTKITAIPPTTMANGADFVVPGGSLFQRDAKGVFHLIPDIVTANAMHIDWKKVARVAGVKPIGAPIRSVVVSVHRTCAKSAAPSFKANGNEYVLPNGNVYELIGGAYHLVPDLATADAMGVMWNRLHRINSLSSAGTPIPSVCVA